MNNQASFSSKDKSKKLKCRLLQFLFCALRVKQVFDIYMDLSMPSLLLVSYLVKRQVLPSKTISKI